jgi:hypothetical protein
VRTYLLLHGGGGSAPIDLRSGCNRPTARRPQCPQPS